MIVYKDILSKLKQAGYNTTRLRKEKLLPESVISRLRHNQSINIDSLDSICRMTGLPICELIEYKESQFNNFS